MSEGIALKNSGSKRNKLFAVLNDEKSRSAKRSLRLLTPERHGISEVKGVNC
jgi:hypothetical protein